MINPLRPEEVSSQIGSHIPSEVIKVFNSLLVEHYNGTYATIYQSEVISLLKEKMNVTEDQILKNHWLDVEWIYQKFGWNVEHTKIGYSGVSCPSYFTFRPNIIYRGQ